MELHICSSFSKVDQRENSAKYQNIEHILSLIESKLISMMICCLPNSDGSFKTN